jgi:hypothetical protein
VAEWLADPAGRTQLKPFLDRIPAGTLERAPEMRQLVAQLPVIKLCTFGLGLDAARLTAMVEAVRSHATPAPGDMPGANR